MHQRSPLHLRTTTLIGLGGFIIHTAHFGLRLQPEERQKGTTTASACARGGAAAAERRGTRECLALSPPSFASGQCATTWGDDGPALCPASARERSCSPSHRLTLAQHCLPSVRTPYEPRVEHVCIGCLMTARLSRTGSGVSDGHGLLL